MTVTNKKTAAELREESIKKHDILDLYRSLHRIRFYLEFCLQFRQHVDHKNVVVPEALRRSSAGQT